jgi:hypothetical protein
MTIVMHSYRISGLAVSSEMALPGAIGTPPQGRGDVTVRFGRVPETLPRITASGPTWDMDGDKVLLRVPGLARFLIKEGRDIVVELEPGANARDASGFVLGTSFGILLHQRGALVLHGAAVSIAGRAVAICGHSGAGKSTLAAALCREGFEFVTDDICVLALDAAGHPLVLPDGRQLKLWREAVDRLDLAGRQCAAVRESLEKYFIEPHASAAAAPQLSAIYVLRQFCTSLKCSIESLALPDALRMLEYQSYRPELRAKLGSKPQLLAQAAAVFGHAKIFLLDRPHGFEHIEETIATLRKHWEVLGQ